MDTTIVALRNLYVAFGGSADDVADITTIAEMINAIATQAGSTIELPKVSSTDNGKVLTVDDGEWVAKTQPT